MAGALLYHPFTSLFNGNAMGQHQIQRQLLRNFSSFGKQRNSHEVWHLSRSGFRPSRKSISKTGFFEVACSAEIDQYITNLENGFKSRLARFGTGVFNRSDFDRSLFDFVALHYVRSEACRNQIEFVLEKSVIESRISASQSIEEFQRLTSHQHLSVFRKLVQNVASHLTNFVVFPEVFTSGESLLTSDKIIHAAFVKDQRRTMVWFPLTPNSGLRLISDGPEGQILGPVSFIDPNSGQIEFVGFDEATILRAYEPVPRVPIQSEIRTLNALMADGANNVYANDLAAIDSALSSDVAKQRFRYKPI